MFGLRSLRNLRVLRLVCGSHSCDVLLRKFPSWQLFTTEEKEKRCAEHKQCVVSIYFFQFFFSMFFHCLAWLGNWFFIFFSSLTFTSQNMIHLVIDCLQWNWNECLILLLLNVRPFKIDRLKDFRNVFNWKYEKKSSKKIDSKCFECQWRLFRSP